MSPGCGRFPQLHVFLALLAFLCGDAARADDPDAIVNFACDPANAEFRIEERFEDAPDNAPYPRLIRAIDMEFSTRGLAWAKEVDGQVVWEDREIHRNCTIGSDKYVAIFSAYKPNWSVQGECGGGTSTVAFTVSLNNEVLIKDLVLHENCRSDQEIESVRFLSRTREIVAKISRRGTEELRYVRATASLSVSRDTLFAVAASAAAP